MKLFNQNLGIQEYFRANNGDPLPGSSLDCFGGYGESIARVSSTASADGYKSLVLDLADLTLANFDNTSAGAPAGITSIQLKILYQIGANGRISYVRFLLKGNGTNYMDLNSGSYDSSAPQFEINLYPATYLDLSMTAEELATPGTTKVWGVAFTYYDSNRVLHDEVAYFAASVGADQVVTNYCGFHRLATDQGDRFNQDYDVVFACTSDGKLPIVGPTIITDYTSYKVSVNAFWHTIMIDNSGMLSGYNTNLIGAINQAFQSKVGLLSTIFVSR